MKKFWASKRGNVAMMFGIAALPLAVMAGFGIDLWRQTTAIAAAQNAVDAAVLAAAASDTEDSTELKGIVDAYLAANVQGVHLRGDYATQVEYVDQEFVHAVITGVTPAFFAGLIGRDTLPVRAEARATRGSNDFIEVALVLDNTWSMSESDGTGTTKIAGLKTAATSLVNALMAREDERVKISLVPYADYVNIGVENRNQPWMNVAADRTVVTPRPCTWVTTRQVCTGGVRGTCPTNIDGVPGTTACWTTPQTCVTEEITPYQSCPADSVTNYRFYGCVASRNVGNLRLNDSLPLTPYPGLSQTSQTCLNPLLPLTQTRATVLSQINGLIVNRGSYKPATYIPGGLVWGINVLSPTEPFTDGRAYGEGTRKIMVLMTDGENTLRYNAANGQHVALSSNATTAATQMTQTNNDTQALCTYAKSQGMEIYTVGLGVDSTTARNMLRDCATSTAHAFNADDAATLVEAFQQIARSINSVRLVD